MTLNPVVMITSLNLRILSILFIRIFFFSKSYLSNRAALDVKASTSSTFISRADQGETVTYRRGPFAITVLKTLSFLSVISLAFAVKIEFASSKVTLSLWLKNTPTKISLNFIYDQYFLVFLSVALIVTWSIMEFSFYYMVEDPKGTAFFRLLTIFLLKMLILTCSKRLFLIFLG